MYPLSSSAEMVHLQHATGGGATIADALSLLFTMMGQQSSLHVTKATSVVLSTKLEDLVFLR